MFRCPRIKLPAAILGLASLAGLCTTFVMAFALAEFVGEGRPKYSEVIHPGNPHVRGLIRSSRGVTRLQTCLVRDWLVMEALPSPAVVVTPSPDWPAWTIMLSPESLSGETWYDERASGWPFHALCDAWTSSARRPSLQLRGIKTSLIRHVGRNVVLPTHPIWPGLLADSAIFGTGWALLLGTFPLAKRWRRARSGGCARCGYDVSGLPSGTCPECGTPVPSPAVGCHAPNRSPGATDRAGV